MPPSDTSAAVAAGSVFSQAANWAAACWCLDAAITPVEEPPQLPTTLPPAVHLPLAGAGRRRGREVAGRPYVGDPGDVLAVVHALVPGGRPLRLVVHAASGQQALPV